MLHLDNDDIIDLLPMSEVMSALQVGYDQLATGEAAHVPRLELWSPAENEHGYHCLGSMAGTTKHFGYTAIRIKSDVIHWPEGKRQEKYAVEPGTFCGFILLFATATGEPVALINDGALQRMRVGGTAGVVADALANADASSVGIIGAGDMARTYLEAISLTRALKSVKVYSPTAANREAFAVEMAEKIGVTVEAVDSAEAANIGLLDCGHRHELDDSHLATGVAHHRRLRRERDPARAEHRRRGQRGPGTPTWRVQHRASRQRCGHGVSTEWGGSVRCRG
jgi:alanine dehydrogenase